MSGFWEDATGVLGKVAPMLATAVGGPLAGAATSVIVKALGLAPDTTQEQAAAAVANATPDQLLALKRADQEFAETMAKLELDADRLVSDDRANARSQTVALAQAGSAAQWGAPAVSVIVLLGFALVLVMILTRRIPEGSEAIVNVMLGTLGTMAVGVVQYWTGSSSGSRDKSNQIQQLAQLAAQQVPADLVRQ